jgi:hypothetical protein
VLGKGAEAMWKVLPDRSRSRRAESCEVGLFESRKQRDPYAVDVQQSFSFLGRGVIGRGEGGGLGLRAI